MAGTALFLWPFIALGLYWSLGPRKGLIWSFLLGYLFLPEAIGFNLQGLPEYNKRMAIGVSCLFGMLIWRKRSAGANARGDETYDRSSDWVFFALVSLLFISLALTVLTNRDPIHFTGSSKPALGVQDLISMTSSYVIALLPFLAARQILADESAHRDLLAAMFATGLVYSMLVLFEIRMSPQLHTWVYGYFQHIWGQHERGGGFRPIVFLRHGLFVGFFLFVAAMAALSLWRQKQKGRRQAKYLLAGFWFLVILFFSHNLSAVFVSVCLAPLIFLFGRRLQLGAMALVACLLMILPAVRYANFLPIDSVVSLAERVSPERAHSLQFRFDQEAAILERASQRPVFGWGIWARWRIYDETGRDLSTVDGAWITAFGEQGAIGYFAIFGFFCAPLMLLARVSRSRSISPATLGLGIIMTGNLIYMIPNSAIGLISWLVAGALFGFARQKYGDRPDAVDPAATRNRQPVYSRFSGDRLKSRDTNLTNGKVSSMSSRRNI